MPALVIFGLRLLRLAVYVEAAVIVALGLLCLWLFVRLAYVYGRYEHVRDERDAARATLNAIRRMGEVSAETVARLRGLR